MGFLPTSSGVSAEDFLQFLYSISAFWTAALLGVLSNLENKGKGGGGGEGGGWVGALQRYRIVLEKGGSKKGIKQPKTDTMVTQKGTKMIKKATK